SIRDRRPDGANNARCGGVDATHKTMYDAHARAVQQAAHVAQRPDNAARQASYRLCDRRNPANRSVAELSERTPSRIKRRTQTPEKIRSVGREPLDRRCHRVERVRNPVTPLIDRGTELIELL